MPNILFADVAGILGKGQTIVDALKAANQPVPGAVSDLISKANTILSNWPVQDAPHGFIEQLDDLAQIAAYLEPQIGSLPHASGLTNIVQAIQGTAAGVANLASGQLALFGTYPSSFDGTPDRIVVGVWRASGSFGRMVESGVSDANDVEDLAAPEPEPELPSAVAKAPSKKSKA